MLFDLGRIRAWYFFPLFLTHNYLHFERNPFAFGCCSGVLFNFQRGAFTGDVTVVREQNPIIRGDDLSSIITALELKSSKKDRQKGFDSELQLRKDENRMRTGYDSRRKSIEFTITLKR